MELILVNGKIVTMNSEQPVVEAVAVKDGKFVKVGKNEDVLSLKDKDTVVVDLEGKLVVPGFNDSHMHLVNYGYGLQNVKLTGVKNIDEIVERVKNFIVEKNISKGKWIRGRGWNHDYFVGEKVFPTRYDLDRISTEHAIVLTRACGHVAIANSKAMELAGIDKNTPKVEGGHFDVDENGEPLGIFRENALDLVYDAFPKPEVEDIKRMLLDAIRDANKCGITSVGTDDFETLPGKDYERVMAAYKELKAEGKLSLRVNEQCLLQNMGRLKGFLDKGYMTGQGDEFFRIGPLKLLADGSLGARTAALTRPYADCPETCGLPVFTQEELDALVELGHSKGMNIAVHCIGNKIMYMTLEAYEKALKKYPREDHRHGIVHCQITDEPLLQKFKELNAIAYIQPIFLDYDWHIVKDRVGADLERTSYNWKTMIDKGIHIACGSDAPVESFDVLNGIYEAVTRKDLKGEPEGGWLPEQKLTVHEALYGFTMGGAYATFEENSKGSIEEGKLADMVVLERDIFEIPGEEIKDTEIKMTVFGGKVVYEK